METKGWKSFWTSLWVTLLVLLPLVAATILFAQYQSAQRVRASESQSGVPVLLPREENHLTLLTCVAGEDPAFLLLYLNADQNCIHLMAVPGQLAVPFSDGEATLAACYNAAGPARCLQGLREVLDLPEDAHYLAATTDTLVSLCDSYGNLRVGFSGALTASELERFEQAGVGDWSAAAAHAFLTELSQTLAPETVAGARAAVWDAFFRQNREGREQISCPIDVRTFAVHAVVVVHHRVKFRHDAVEGKGRAVPFAQFGVGVFHVVDDFVIFQPVAHGEQP